MLRQIETKICDADKQKVGKLIDNVNDTIGAVNEIKKLSQGINDKILESVGNTYAPDIILKSELSGDIKDIFRKLKIKLPYPFLVLLLRFHCLHLTFVYTY